MNNKNIKIGLVVVLLGVIAYAIYEIYKLKTPNQ